MSLVVVINGRAFSMARAEYESLLSMIAPRSKGIYGLQKGDTVMLVNEPYSAQRVLEHEADGWTVRYRR